MMAKTTAETRQPKRVLIVEDEGDMCLLLNIILTGKDLELDHVKNLAAAADYLKDEQPAIVILDNKLPDGFGVDLIPEIKKAYPSIKIIMISGFDSAVKDVALENGADVYLEKPFKRDQLFQAIMGLLNEPVTA
jgi:two-component system, OmpR family, response regulator